MKKATLFAIVAMLMSAQLTPAQPHKYALALYHFNIQYVAGGLRGIINNPGGVMDQYWESVLEDLIVTESFEPLLDLFLKHENWGADFELQGYFLEVLSERHPTVLEKLKTLVNRGQIDLVSFHYSDQLFLAYSSYDMEKSISITDDIASSLGLEIAPVVFTQEGQASSGAIEFASKHNRNIYIYPKNLYIYQYGDWNNAPFYKYSDGVYVIFGPKGASWNNPQIEVTWTFLDDGELLATGGIDPYFAPLFTYKPKAVEDYEAELTSLEANGYKISRISDFVEETLELGYVPPDCPILLDGTWQPSESRNVTKWMGDNGLWIQTERDNLVLTLNTTASAELKAMETLWAWAESNKKVDLSELEELKSAAWKHLLLGQVSDSTGWRPWRGEVEYSIAHAAYALALALEIERKIKEAAELNTPIWIDTYTNNVSSAPNRKPIEFEDSEPNAESELKIEAPCRNYEVFWEVGTYDSKNIWRITIEFGKADECQDPYKEDVIKVQFAWNAETIVYKPALSESLLEADTNQFTFEEFSLPLANGWIQLSDNLQLIKDIFKVHVSANLYPQTQKVSFEDATSAKDVGTRWVFYLLESDPQSANELADMINVYPEVQR